jgi:O-antigen/teichoic acid export membrane protein
MLSSLAKPVAFFKSFINTGHTRSINAKKNILATILIKGCSIVISFILFPITMNYINPSTYGIWLTLSAIVGWFSFFDIGLSQGLRNKFAEAKAKGDDSLAQVYVSTTYAILGIIFFCIWLVFIIFNQHLNWSKILNVPQNMQSEISVLAVIVFTYFCLQFVLKIITTILTADQQPAKASLIEISSQIAVFVFVLILVKVTKGSLIRLGIVFCVAPLLVLAAANFFLFKGMYKKYKPSLSKVNFFYAKGLFNLGVVFFIIQIAGIIQYETANIMIARNFSTADVTSYNVVYKYFGITNMVFTIFLTPFWSASTEAYFKNDIQWIKNGIKKYNLLNIVLIGVSALMLVFSSNFFNLWLGHGKVNISFSLSFWAFIFFNVIMFGGKYVFFLNGISALRMQFWASILGCFLYVLIAIILIKYFHMGVYALFIASVIANFNAYLLAPLQYYKIINKNKKGIWVK